MKPLTHWAIHHQQKLRIAGHSAVEIWGLLVAIDGSVRPFRYLLEARSLAIGEGEASHVLQLDEYGYEQ
jgi:hypothetical protein